MGLIEGKTAIITGAGTGIGFGIAKHFHGEGAKIVMCGRRMDKLRESSSKISPTGERIYPVQADVTKEEDIKRVVEEAVKKTGRIDILVNNAGVQRFGKLCELDLATWELIMNTNARAPWRMMAAVAPEMRKAGGGSIINISSLSGIHAQTNNGMYGASKAAMQKISQVMALELAPDNIRVNVLCPGTVEETELLYHTIGKENVESRYGFLASLAPLGKNAKPKDLAEAALFLASDKSSIITGILLNVDGGRHIAVQRPPGSSAR